MVKPGSIAAQLNEAVALHRRGAIGPAAQIYQSIIDRDPRNADAYQLLGVVARQMGKRDLALHLLVTALEFNPHHAAALANHAVLLRESGDLPQARVQAEAAVRANPKYAEAHIALGGVLQAMHAWEDARRHYQTAARLQPDNPALLNDMALVERRLGHLSAAYTAAMQGLRLAPAMPELHNTRGQILRAAGYPDAACSAFAAAAAHDPGLADAGINEALACLLIGDFARGWELFAQRGKIDPRVAHVPAWDGRTDPQCVLLVQAEQGLGDAVQFARLLPWAAARVARVVLEVPTPLRELMTSSFPDIDVMTPEDQLPSGVTRRCRLLDLAGYVPLIDDEIPGVAPYLRVAETPLPELLASCAAPRVGLVWAGNPGHLNDANRSLRLAQFADICAPMAGHMVSLQKVPQIGELAASGLKIVDAAPLLHDFAATAALLQHIDLVVTVDTSVAHLAGALGRPVWIMLPFDPDWRWQLERHDVPWYPTAKLYRQPAPGAWADVLAAVGRDLARFADGDRSVLAPGVWKVPLPRRQLQGAAVLPDFTE
ncbi:MAG: tetratricopeptide repeat protein [Alphaproteobacteria bacterium]